MKLSAPQLAPLMELMYAHHQTPFSNPEIQKLAAQWETEDVVVSGDVAFGPGVPLFFPKKELRIEGNLSRSSIPYHQATRMPETIICKEYLFKYETPLPAKSLCCTRIIFSTNATLPNKIPNIKVTDGLAGIQKQHLPALKPFLDPEQSMLSKKELRKKQTDEIIAAINNPTLFTELTNKYPKTKDLISALEERNATREWAELVSNPSTSDSLINFSPTNYIAKMLDAGKQSDIEHICATLPGNFLLNFDLPATPQLLNAITSRSNTKETTWLTLPTAVFSTPKPPKQLRAWERSGTQESYNAFHKNKSESLLAILSALVTSGGMIRPDGIEKLVDPSSSKAWYTKNASVIKAVITKPSLERFVKECHQLHWEKEDPVTENFLIPTYKLLGINPSLQAVQHFPKLLPLTKEAQTLTKEEAQTDIGIF